MDSNKGNLTLYYSVKVSYLALDSTLKLNRSFLFYVQSIYGLRNAAGHLSRTLLLERKIPLAYC